jgi:NADH:ubiquinone oxidoreductase subunit
MLRRLRGLSTRCCGRCRSRLIGAALDGTPRGRYGPRVLKSIFTWWNGATIGIRFTAWRRGVFIGEDDFGNRYYEARDNKDSYDARKRRWVIYNGYAEASKVPPDWHGWLHYTFDEPPTIAPLKRRSWEKEHLPNLTGTVDAWRPTGSIARTGERPRATGDYQAWRPE